MEAVEHRTVVHRGFFTYSVLKVVPNLENIVPAGQNLDIFFFIFGTPSPTPRTVRHRSQLRGQTGRTVLDQMGAPDLQPADQPAAADEADPQHQERG